MPGVRSEGQKLIGCWCDADFVLEIDQARKALPRSQFCRDALREKLARMGFPVPDEITIAPDRKGKGGPRVKVKRPRPPQAKKSSSVEADDTKDALALIDAIEAHDAAHSQPERGVAVPAVQKARRSSSASKATKKRSAPQTPAQAEPGDQ